MWAYRRGVTKGGGTAVEATETAQKGDDGRHAFDFFFGSWEQSNRSA
jgi:hypothetical protein